MASPIDSKRSAAAAALAEARRRAAAEAAKKAAAAAAVAAKTKQARVAKPIPKAIARLKTDGFSVARGKALGAPAIKSPPIKAPVTPPKQPTPAEAGATETQRLTTLAATDPAAAAEQLATALHNPDPAYHQAVVDGADQVAAQVAEGLKKADQAAMEQAVAALAQSASAAGPEGAQAMGAAFAQHMTSGFGGGFEQFGDVLIPQSPAATAFLGATLTVPGMGDFVNGMYGAAKAAGNDALVGDLVGLSLASATFATTAFNEASQKVDQLNAELNSLVQGFGPGDEAQLAAAVTDFKQRHAEEYAAFEAASVGVLNATALSAGLGADLPALALGPLVEVVKLAPKALASDAGQALLGDTLEAQARGENPPLLAALTAAGSSDPEIAEQLAPVFTQAAGARVAALQAAGKTGEAQAVVDALAENAEAIGLPKGALNDYAAALNAVLDGDPGALATLKLATDSVNALLPDTKVLSSSLKSLGFVVGVVSLPGALEGFSDADIENQVGTIASTLGLGNDGALLAVKTLANPSTFSAVESVLGKVGTGLAVIGAVTGTIDFAQAVEEGNLADISVAGLNAAASIALCIPGGQLIGVGLAVAGFVVDLFVGQARQRAAEHASEDDAYAFLVASGMDPEFARVFSNLNDQKQNIGPFVEEVAQQLGLSQDELISRLNDSEGADRGQLLALFGSVSQAAEVFGSFDDGEELPIFGPRASVDDIPPELPEWARDDIEEGINERNERRDEIVALIAGQAGPLLD